MSSHWDNSGMHLGNILCSLKKLYWDQEFQEVGSPAMKGAVEWHFFAFSMKGSWTWKARARIRNQISIGTSRNIISADQPGDVTPKQELDLLDVDSILLRMEETSEWGIVSVPNSTPEADLLLETARAQCKLCRIQKQLADQLVQCNLL
ncbi:hypothetical protein BKA83DRAFT_4123871 [Pisolithus microcarpus]|nr:hypothetical protein BKA83DRAFT_4123871 [Pisolithus microcarpus]